jgi:hypothetical protein
MPCDCKRCREHLVTLGLDQKPASPEAIREAYRDAVQVWHPDRFEGNQRLRLKAEEQFKRVQVAYRELVQHEPAAAAPPPPPEPARNQASEPVRCQRPQRISFDGAPGCFTATEVPPRIVKRVREYMGSAEVVLGAVALSDAIAITSSSQQSQHADSAPDDLRFFALTNNGLMVNDGWTKNSCIRYRDLGELTLDTVYPIFLMNDPPFPLQKQLGLRIDRADKRCYYLLWYSPDNSVVQTVHDFLQQMKASESL